MRLLSALLSPLRLLLRLLAWPLAARRRRRAAGEGWLELWLEGAVVELPTPPRLPAWLRRRLGRKDPPRVALSRLRRFAELASADPRVKGVLIRLGPLGGAWASAEAIRAALVELREAGKRVVVHIPHAADNRAYAIATAADEILIPPVGAIAAVGTAARGLYLREALSRLGIEIAVAAAGRYKSAPERFTRDTRSKADLEQTRALVDGLDAALVGWIEEGRGLSREAAVAALDAAPLVGAEAERHGLVDGLARDEALLGRLSSGDAVPKLVGAGSYLEAREPRPLFGRRRPRHVGLVEVHGAIVEARSGFSDAMDKAAEQAVVVADLRAALEDDAIAAVVLHVDSRGGGVMASDAICSAVRRLDADKPVIACFGDVAASGGYYVACGARGIVASPLTVTGSIGVFAMLPVAAGLSARLGLHHDVVKNRENADLFDLWRARSPREQDHLQREIDQLYGGFLDLVAEARKLERSAVAELAEGRVWLGRDAAERGLVDGLGGLPEALARAREAAGGRVEDRPLRVRARRSVLPRPPPPEAPKATAALLGLLGDPRLLELAAVQAATPGRQACLWAPL
jgi:protease-4